MKTNKRKGLTILKTLYIIAAIVSLTMFLLSALNFRAQKKQLDDFKTSSINNPDLQIIRYYETTNKENRYVIFIFNDFTKSIKLIWGTHFKEDIQPFFENGDWVFKKTTLDFYGKLHKYEGTKPKETPKTD